MSDDCFGNREEMIARYKALKAENERLKESLSYLPKVPTEPYEKEMAKKISTLELELSGHYSALSKKIDENIHLKAKLAEVEAERERLEDLLGAIHDTTLEADTKSRIANNLDATPNGWRFRKSQLTREREAARVMREALEAAMRIESLWCPTVAPEHISVSEAHQFEVEARALHAMRAKFEKAINHVDKLHGI